MGLLSLHSQKKNGAVKKFFVKRVRETESGKRILKKFENKFCSLVSLLYLCTPNQKTGKQNENKKLLKINERCAVKGCRMVQIHSISSINDDIGTLSNWRIATLFKFFERLGKNKSNSK